MWKEFALVNSYTCEASFCGASQGLYKGLHFNINMLLDMGRDFCRALAVYSEQDSSYYNSILAELHQFHDSNAPIIEQAQTMPVGKANKLAQLTDMFGGDKSSKHKKKRKQNALQLNG